MLLAADNLHALNPLVSEALRTLDPAPIQEIAKKCQNVGANYLDINPGYLSKKYEDRIDFMIEAVQEVSSLRLIIDSPNPRVLSRGIKLCKIPPILNGVSLEEVKVKEILPLAAEHKLEVILFLMNEQSFTPPSLDEKLSIAVELMQKATEFDIPYENIIFDPVLPTLSWQDAFLQVSSVVEVVRMISSGRLFEAPIKTVAGLSNLRSGLKKRYSVKIDEVALSLLAGAGLSIVLADALNSEIVTTFQILKLMSG